MLTKSLSNFGKSVQSGQSLLMRMVAGHSLIYSLSEPKSSIHKVVRSICNIRLKDYVSSYFWNFLILSRLPSRPLALFKVGKSSKNSQIVILFIMTSDRQNERNVSRCILYACCWNILALNLRAVGSSVGLFKQRLILLNNPWIHMSNGLFLRWWSVAS